MQSQPIKTKEQDRSMRDEGEPRQRSRSREKKGEKKQPQSKGPRSRIMMPHQRLKAGEMQYEEYLQKQSEFHENQELLRSFLRIEQGRQEPIDYFVKAIYTYKGKYEYDSKINDIMTSPKKYLNSLSVESLQDMIEPAQRHLANEEKNGSDHEHFWKALIELIDYKLQKKKRQPREQSLDVKQKVKKMLDKPKEELVKLQKKIDVMLKNASFGVDMSYWENIKSKVKGKLLEIEIINFYDEFKAKMNVEEDVLDSDEDQAEPISPTLGPYNVVNSKLIITEAQDLEERKKLDSDIFRVEFQAGKDKLQTNLSLPKNHNLLTKDFKNEAIGSYDVITQEIIEFEKYRRMEGDQQQFDQWIPVETEGRFRDRYPEYINRVRVHYEKTRYGLSGMIKARTNENNPRPKIVQGYKFNIFYPDLYDKQKTPQYYLQELEDPAFCMIKFKAGPPYKDIAFKILRKEWDMTSKSGFEAIFTKGILQLYFNFKKPKYRI